MESQDLKQFTYHTLLSYSSTTAVDRVPVFSSTVTFGSRSQYHLLCAVPPKTFLLQCSQSKFMSLCMSCQYNLFQQLTSLFPAKQASPSSCPCVWALLCLLWRSPQWVPIAGTDHLFWCDLLNGSWTIQSSAPGAVNDSPAYKSCCISRSALYC